MKSDHDRVALLSAVCRLSNYSQFVKAGFLLNGAWDIDNARRKHKVGAFIPAYADEGIISKKDKQNFERKKFFCQVFKWAINKPDLFQSSNIPLLKRGIC